MKISKYKSLLVVLSSPSGGGKTAIADLLLRKHPEFSRSISATTRRKRAGEKNGVDYFYISQENFQKKIDRDEFVEWAKVFGNYYGTPKKNIQKAEGKKEVLLLILDVQGGISLKRKYPQSVLIFVLPPSLAELKKRLVNRGTDRAEAVKRRLKDALKELNYCRKYDYVVVNKDLDETVEKIEKIIIAEKHRTERMPLDDWLEKNKSGGP